MRASIKAMKKKMGFFLGTKKSALVEDVFLSWYEYTVFLHRWFGLDERYKEEGGLLTWYEEKCFGKRCISFLVRILFFFGTSDQGHEEEEEDGLLTRYDCTWALGGCGCSAAASIKAMKKMAGFLLKTNAQKTVNFFLGTIHLFFVRAARPRLRSRP